MTMIRICTKKTNWLQYPFLSRWVRWFMAGFTSKKVNYILRSAIQILCLMEYMRFVDDDSNWCVLVIVICFQISHVGLLQGPQKPCWNSYLKCNFKSILEKKYQHFSKRGLFLCFTNETLIEVPPYQETSPARKNSWLRACAPYPVLEEDEFLIKYS